MKHVVVFTLLLCLPLLASAQPDPWLETVITDQLPGALGVTPVDLEHDGDTDILAVAYSAGEVWWFEQTELGWNEHVIVDTLSTPIFLATGDIDSDGDEDFVTMSFLQGVVYWFANSPLGWTSHVIDLEFDHGRRILASDIDNDGDLDIIGSSESIGVVLWRNNGDGDFTRSTVAGSLNTAYGIDVADMDDDDDLDVLVCDYGDGDVNWYENTGAAWTVHAMYSGNMNPQEISAADIDNDFDMDAVVSFDQSSTIAWLENLGNNDWSLRTITSEFTDPNDVVAVDIDNDSDPDVVSSSYSGATVAYWENDGGQWVENILSGEFTNAWSVGVADMDGDNDLDIVSSSYWAGIISFWSQPGIGFPVSISMFTNWWPIEIPPNGGNFMFGFRLQNATGNLYTGAHYWNQVVYPSGNMSGPFNVANAVIGPFMDTLIWNFTQHVPANAPAGQYTYIARIGYPQAFAEGNFVFTKLASRQTGSVSDSDWDMGPVAFAGEEDVSTSQVSDNRTLLSVTPNPFNAATVVQLYLPETTEVNVAVYNISGQKVATLASGILQAGNHPLSFSAGDLASGVYFVHAIQQGQEPQNLKLLVIR